MTQASIDLPAFLDARSDAILKEAAEEVLLHRLPSYEAAGREVTEARIRTLFELLVRSSRDRSLEPALEYAESLGGERHRSGYALAEVQRVINVLEETVWSSITAEVAPAEQGYALGLVSTILGAVKDRLACSYVAGISSAPAATLHLDYLFAGSEGDTHSD